MSFFFGFFLGVTLSVVFCGAGYLLAKTVMLDRQELVRPIQTNLSKWLSKQKKKPVVNDDFAVYRKELLEKDANDHTGSIRL